MRRILVIIAILSSNFLMAQDEKFYLYTSYFKAWNAEKYTLNGLTIETGRDIGKGLEVYLRYTNGSGGLKTKYIIPNHDENKTGFDDNDNLNLLQIRSVSLGLRKNILLTHRLKINLDGLAYKYFYNKQELYNFEYHPKEGFLLIDKMTTLLTTDASIGYAFEIGMAYAIKKTTNLKACLQYAFQPAFTNITIGLNHYFKI